MLDWDVFRRLYLLWQTPLLLKKFSQVQDGVCWQKEKNIVCMSLISVLTTSIKDGDESNSS